MPDINFVVAIDERRGMGKNNQLLCHLPADLRHFKNITLGKPVIMGRKTYESIGQPLPGRLNIVLSRTVFNIQGATVAKTIEDALEKASESSEIMIIGGSQLFEQTITMVQRIYLTRVHHQFEADVFFPELDETQWRCISAMEKKHDNKNPYDMTFYIYERNTNS